MFSSIAEHVRWEFSSMIVSNAIVIELKNMIAELHWLGLTEFSCEVVN